MVALVAHQLREAVVSAVPRLHLGEWTLNGSFDGGIYARSMTGDAEGHINPLYDRELCTTQALPRRR